MVRGLSLVVVRTGREAMQPIVMGLLWFGDWLLVRWNESVKTLNALGLIRGVSIFKARQRLHEQNFA